MIGIMNLFPLCVGFAIAVWTIKESINYFEQEREKVLGERERIREEEYKQNEQTIYNNKMA